MVRSDRVAFSQRYPSFDEYWEESMDCGAPLAAVVEELDAADVEAVRSATREALAQFTTGDGRIDIPASEVVAAAVT